MEVGFPNLMGREKHTLFIIGNGFDRYHKIKSSYKHFCSWLYLNGHEEFVDTIERMFTDSFKWHDNLWSNFEDVISHYEPDRIQFWMNIAPHNVFNKHDVDESMIQMKKTARSIRPLMKTWAEHIEIGLVKPQMKDYLSQYSLYLTFNYTKVLEKVYNIPRENICHIHGCVGDDVLIVGHDSNRSPYSINTGKDEEEIPQGEIVKEMNKLNKNIDDQIKKHKSFFESLSNIHHVVVLGHSIAGVDFQYYRKIHSIVPKDTHWYFSQYSFEDGLRIRRFIDLCQIDSRNSYVFQL
jgi:hypothetical protein